MVAGTSTEQKIIQAAKKIFSAKGLAGARMQDIADEAQINKAMLHYYFRNKQKLFEIVFDEQFHKLISSFSVILNSELDLQQKLEQFIQQEFAVFSEYPELPLFILYEANQDPGRVEKRIKNKPIRAVINAFVSSVETGIRQKKIKPIDPLQLLINVMSLCIYPFIAQPLFQTVLNINQRDYKTMMEDRPKLISQWIWESIKV